MSKEISFRNIDGKIFPRMEVLSVDLHNKSGDFEYTTVKIHSFVPMITNNEGDIETVTELYREIQVTDKENLEKALGSVLSDVIYSGKMASKHQLPSDMDWKVVYI